MIYKTVYNEEKPNITVFLFLFLLLQTNLASRCTQVHLRVTLRNAPAQFVCSRHFFLSPIKKLQKSKTFLQFHLFLLFDFFLISVLVHNVNIIQSVLHSLTKTSDVLLTKSCLFFLFGIGQTFLPGLLRQKIYTVKFLWFHISSLVSLFMQVL